MKTMTMSGVSGSHEMHAAAVALTPSINPSALQRMVKGEQFLGMLSGFRRSGGLVRGRDLACAQAIQSGMKTDTLARWIAEGEVVHFDWQSDTWFPMFQFGGQGIAPHESVGRVLKELHGVFDPWDIAQWFARPSVTLGYRTPADAMASAPDSVLQAARYDRYVVDA